MKKKIVIGAIFAALLMLSMPAVTNIQATTAEEAIEENGECNICGDSETRISQFFEKLGIPSKDLITMQLNSGNPEPQCFLLIYLILWLIENIFKVVKCVACALFLIPFIPLIVVGLIFCNSFDPWPPDEPTPFCQFIGDMFSIYADACL